MFTRRSTGFKIRRVHAIRWTTSTELVALDVTLEEPLHGRWQECAKPSASRARKESRRKKNPPRVAHQLTRRETQYQGARTPSREEFRICNGQIFQQRSPPAQSEPRHLCPTPGDPLNNDHDTNELTFDALNVVLTRVPTLEARIMVL